MYFALFLHWKKLKLKKYVFNAFITVWISLVYNLDIYSCNIFRDKSFKYLYYDKIASGRCILCVFFEIVPYRHKKCSLQRFVRFVKKVIILLYFHNFVLSRLFLNRILSIFWNDLQNNLVWDKVEENFTITEK